MDGTRRCHRSTSLDREGSHTILTNRRDRGQGRDLIASAIDRILVLCDHPSTNNKLFLAGFATLLLGVCLARAYAGLACVRVYPQDSFSFLDGAWRLMNRQIPSLDFFSDLGPIIYLQTRVGLLLSHGDASGFGYGQAITAAVLGVWAYAIGGGRLSHTPRMLFCASLVFLAVSPVVIGEDPTRTTAACVYNRYGVALTALVMLEAFCESKRQSRRAELLAGLSTGTAVGLALFVKVTYFLGVGFLLLELFACRRQTLHRWKGIVAGSGAVFLAFWPFLGYTFIPMWNDLRTVAGSKHIEFKWYMVDALFQGLAPFLIFVFLAAALLWNIGERETARKIGVLAMATSAVGLFYMVTSAQGNRLPLNALLAIIVVHVVSTCFAAAPESQRLGRCVFIMWGALFIFSHASWDLAGAGYAVMGKLRIENSPLETFHSPRLAGFRTTERRYVALVNDGLDLLNKHRRQDDTVMSLDFSNPFSFGLGAKPAWGGVPVLKYGINFDETHFPAAERYFGRASLVMLPKQFTDGPMTEFIPKLYGPYLASHFHLVGETALWQLFRHNK